MIHRAAEALPSDGGDAPRELWGARSGSGIRLPPEDDRDGFRANVLAVSLTVKRQKDSWEKAFDMRSGFG